MTRRDEHFRLRPRPPKARNAGFVTRVLTEVSRSGIGIARGLAQRPGARSGRGHTVARLLGRSQQHPSMRRVAVKVLLVRLSAVSPQSIGRHLRYISRDGVTGVGQPAQPYGPSTNEADLGDFEARSRGDRHQFRFVVSAEDADRLGDLRGYTRELMARMEGDLGTKLDWVAVDHRDTDNPHTHVVLRGKDESGHDLVIAGSYIAHGIRQRAAEIATHWLGPRTELEVRHSLQAEVHQDRWTTLDRRLHDLARGGLVSLAAASELERPLLRQRLDKLRRLGLAEGASDGTFRLRHDLRSILQALGERGDIIRTMQRAMGGTQRELVVADASNMATEITGRVAARGMADELSDRSYLVVDGTDGRAHYVPLPGNVEPDQFPINAIVCIRSARERLVDQTIARLASNGMYRTERNRAELERNGPADRHSEDVITAHVRRLEALRRAGHVERVSDGVWRVPPDLNNRSRLYDARRGVAPLVELESHLSLKEQTHVLGATWLDRQLVGAESMASDRGFGSEVRAALQARVDFLTHEGLAQRRGGRLLLVRDLLAKLRERDVSAAARAIAAESGLEYRPLDENGRMKGVYRRSVLLASGRYAVLDDGMGFSLVPWRPVIEPRLGQALSVVVRAGRISFDMARNRGLGIK